MRAIIFGAGGQDGIYLQRILERDGIEVHAFNHKQCDVGVQGYVCHQIAQLQPDFVFNLSARSSTSHDALWQNHKAIVDGAVNILDAVKTYCPKAKVWLAGSVLQLSMQDAGVNDRQQNASAYAAQRNASVAYARYYRQAGVQAYVGYLSHHDSPRRSQNHLAARIAAEAVQVAIGAKDILTVRDPHDEREWNFAGDMMQAVWEQVKGPCFEAVLGSGKTDTVWNYAKACLRATNPHDSQCRAKREFTRLGPVRSRTSDMRFEHCFQTSLEQLADMMVAAARPAP